jgi:hypothetical protein
MSRCVLVAGAARVLCGVRAIVWCVVCVYMCVAVVWRVWVHACRLGGDMDATRRSCRMQWVHKLNPEFPTPVKVGL